MPEKRGLGDKINDLTMKIAEPLGIFAEIPAVSAIQDGLVGCMPIILIGSIFLIIGTLGTPAIGTSGAPLIGFLAPIASKIQFVNGLTMNFLALYASITIAMAYAEKLGVEQKSSAVLGLGTFLLMTINSITDGMMVVKPFSASGLIVTIITSLAAVKIYKLFLDKKIVIKMPAGVPPNVGNAFSALIPFMFIFTIAWTIRTIIGFDIVTWLEEALKPIFSAADNIFTFTLFQGVKSLLWAAGLHGDNMLSGISTPLVTLWQTQNSEAFLAGTAAVDLPHIWTDGLIRICSWTSTVWPLIILLLTSKVKYHRTFAITAIPEAIFTIVEPVIFGLPLALNPFLMIPFILTTIVSSATTYLMFQLKFVGRFFAQLPWATPPFLNGPLGTGDWKTLIVIVINVAIGLVIYYPFFKAYESNELQKEQERIKEVSK